MEVAGNARSGTARHGQSGTGMGRGLNSGRTVGLADVWESELLIWAESRYRELYLGDQPFPPGWTRAMTDVDESRRVHPGGDPP